MPAFLGARRALAAAPAVNLSTLLDIDLTSTAGGLTCVRSTAATVIDASGNLSAVAANALKRSTAGLTVEGAWTEVAYPTENLVAPWQRANGVTVTENSGISPRGDQTAALFAFDPGNTSGLYLNIAFPAASYVWSFFFKVNSGTPTLKVGTDASYCQIATGTMAVSNFGGATVSVTALANGWYRVLVWLPSQAANAKPSLYALANSGACYFWGVNYVAGTKAFSYVPNPSTSATLAVAADVVTLPQAGIGRVVLTFDDASQQTFSSIDTTQPYSLVAANLNRPLVKRLQGYAA